MGWGGILAAMAQGFGGGMVKNAENGWKEEAAQKEMDWRAEQYKLNREHESKEAELGRKHDFDIINAKEQSAIRTAAAEAGIRARYARSVSGGADYKKIFKDTTFGILQLENNKAHILDQIAKTTEAGGDTTDLNRQLELTERELFRKKNLPEYYKAAQAGGESATSIYLSTTGRTEPVTPETLRSEAISTSQNIFNMNPAQFSHTSHKPTVPTPSNYSEQSKLTTTRVITPAEKAIYDAYVKAGKEREALQHRINEAKRQWHSPDTESGYIYQKYWSK